MNVACKIGSIFILFCFLASCSSTKYVGQGEYLLHDVKMKVNDKHVSRGELKRNIRQKPNTRILGTTRFHLGLYNLSGKRQTKGINQWLRRIGEPPVIYNAFLTQQSAEQLLLYLKNRGFYQAEVQDTVFFKKKKATVEYRIDVGSPTLIEEVNFKKENDQNRFVGQRGLMNLYYRDTVNTLLRTGIPLDIDLLDQERERVTQTLRERGYFNFSKNFVHFLADSSTKHGENVARLFLRITEDADSNMFRQYYIRNIYVNLDHDPLAERERNGTRYWLTHEGVSISYKDELKIKPNVVVEAIQIERLKLYNVKKVLETYSRLQALNLFKFINVSFREEERAQGLKPLDCYIQLTPIKRQSYNIFFEGTHTSGNLGVGGNLTYNHRNLFKAGENLSIGVWGALKKERVDDEKRVFSTRELGAEIKLVTPQFWMPIFGMKDFRRNYAPRTSISMAYSYEYTPYYTRSVANARFGYLWRTKNRKLRYNLDLIDLNYVSMKDVNQDFIDGLRNEYIKNTYKDHMIFSAALTVTYSDQDVQVKNQNHGYFRMNLESSGNLLWGLNRLFEHKREGESVVDRYYTCLGVQYAQFVKADAEYRYNWNLNQANSFVGRVFVGCGYPYGNMKVLPFEESYYSGGANDLRAWQARTLGPGIYTTVNNYPNSVGDFKLAANVEYRFKLIWLLEGALFVDVGNVWNINSKENRPEARLNADFYNRIAVGTGAGLRVNANFFLLRFDLGIKVKDPSLPAGERFVLFNSDGGFKRSVFNIAIGYPF